MKGRKGIQNLEILIIFVNRKHGNPYGCWNTAGHIIDVLFQLTNEIKELTNENPAEFFHTECREIP